MTAMDKKVVRRMIRRLESVPDSYDQSAWFIQKDDESPCGTVACLAGEAVICSAKTVEAGIKLAFSKYDEIVGMAEEVLGLPDDHNLFDVGGYGWPHPYRDQLRSASTREVKARIAAAYLKESLKRGTMIW